MASLQPGLMVARRAWLSELSDRQSYRGSCRLSGLGVGRVPGLGFAVVHSARGRRRRGGRLPAALGLWDGLPSGLGLGSRVRVSSDHLTVLRGGLL